MKVTLFRKFPFEAAHRNSAVPPSSPSARLHGHSYEVTVRVTGTVDPHLGWVVDFSDIKNACRRVIDRLDHRLLNDIEGMTDTSCADVRRWLTERLDGIQPGFAGCDVTLLGAREFRPALVKGAGELPDRVSFGFAAAHHLPHLPPDHKCRRLHGHSFAIDVATHSADQVITRVRGIYGRLGHQCLNEIDGLENPTSEFLARWLWKQFSNTGTEVDQITVQETCMTGCIYRGKE